MTPHCTGAHAAPDPLNTPHPISQAVSDINSRVGIELWRCAARRPTLGAAKRMGRTFAAEVEDALEGDDAVDAVLDEVQQAQVAADLAGALTERVAARMTEVKEGRVTREDL